MKPLLQSEPLCGSQHRLRSASSCSVCGKSAAGWRRYPFICFRSRAISSKASFTTVHRLLRALMVTLRVTLQAFAAAVVIGTLVAFMFVQSRAIEVSLFPYAVLLQVTPVVAIAPLIIILVKNTQLSLTICATLVALFPIISNTTLGLRSVDPGLANYFRMNRAGRLKTLIKLRIPGALPYFFGGLRISSGLALIGAVVAEFVAGTGGRSSGLAYEILDAGFTLDIPRMFAALFLITLAGIGLFGAMVVLSRLALSDWHESEIGAET
jgi:NitT/TauT family transport system permease protein